jgi:uncharacterized protein
MAEFDQQRMQAGTGAQAADIDEGLRAHMLRVYNYMSAALVITGLVAYGAAASGIYVALAATPLIWVVMLAPLGLVFFLSARINKMSAGAAQTTFWIYSALMGLSLSFVFLAYTGESVVTTFFVTAAAFGSLSLYGYTTKRDLSGMGSFMVMGLFGIIIASVVNIFLASSALHFAISVIGILVFAGLTAWDTQDIKNMYFEGDHADTGTKKALMGALRLYLDFVNMFLFMLQFLGNRE